MQVDVVRFAAPTLNVVPQHWLRFPLIVAVFLASVLFVPMNAEAQACNSGLDTAATVIRDANNRPVGAVITNNSATCSYLVGIASYRVVSDLPDDHIETQVLHDAREQLLAPGESVTWTIQVPSCAYQIDAFTGPVLNTFRGGARYSGRKFFAYLEYDANLPLCTPPTCEDARIRDVVGQIVLDPSDDPRCARFINYSADCTYQVGVASYEMFDPPSILETQQLFDSNVISLAPGAEQTICVDRPECAYHLTAFEGDVITSFANGDRYGQRLRDSGTYGDPSRPFCSIPTPTPTVTPTATVTPTPTVTPTVTPTTTPLPLLECAASGPATPASCPLEGSNSLLQLSGNGSSVGSDFVYQWSTDCVGATFDGAQMLSPQLSMPVLLLAGPSISCSATLIVRRLADDATRECSVPVQFSACPTDCAGTVNGSAVADRCGICDGDGSTCVISCTGEEQRERQILIDGYAAELEALVKRLFNMSSRFERKNRERTARLTALAQARDAYIRAWRVGWSLPAIILKCSVTSPCQAMSLQSSIDGYRTAIDQLLRLGEQGSSRLRARQNAQIRARIRTEFRRVRRVHKEAVAELANIPTSNSVCP